MIVVLCVACGSPETACTCASPDEHLPIVVEERSVLILGDDRRPEDCE